MPSQKTNPFNLAYPNRSQMNHPWPGLCLDDLISIGANRVFIWEF